jgi:fatty-acyl-CoA synthase
MTHTDTVADTRLTGPAIPAQVPPLEEIIRPFAAADRGVSFLHEQTRLGLSYRDLAGRACAAAARLRRLGVRPGEFVAMTISNDLPSVLALLGTWACGATAVSLPPFPRRASEWYARQFDRTLQGMGCGFLIEGDQPFGLPGQDGLRRIAKPELADDPGGPVTSPDTAAPAVALVQFTSGSVGTPRGVAIGSPALAAHMAAVSAVLQVGAETDRLVSWLPVYHDLGLGLLLLGLAARVDTVLAQPAAFAARPASWLTMLARERATLTTAPDFGYRLAAQVPYPDGLDLSRVRVAISGGERIQWQTLLDFQAAAEPMGLRWEAICPGYGLAEATLAVSLSPPGRGPLRGPGGHVSVGVPMPGVTIEARAGASPGPVKVRGDSLFSGYHTGQGFESLARDGWLDTGDDGFVHDEELYVLGRRDEVLSIAGRNVFAEDLESVAHEACGQRIRACAAFRNLASAGRFALLAEANPRIVRGQAAVSELARLLQSSVTDALGTRPAPVLVTRIGTIPRTTSGKVQRARCRSLYDSGQLGNRLLAELT